MNSIELASRGWERRARAALSVLALAATCSCSGSGSNSTARSSGGSGLTGGTAASGGASSVGSTQSIGGAKTLVGNSSSTGTAAASGGAAALGGSNATGGTAALGGSNATGGTTALGGSKTTGGLTSAGGSTATGGSHAPGGTVATGGSGASSGGTKTTGGSISTGGNASIGGSKTTGGSVASGGTKAMGGTASTGGTKATGGASSTAGSTSKCSVYIAGDSTVSTYTLTSSTKDQAGWGQMLQQYYDSNFATVVNKAAGGMTARHFIQAGNMDAILALLKPGDYFLVQFGTNDSNTTATYTINNVSYPYYADPKTDFKTYLQQYIDGTLAKSAIPVLVTPPPRNSAYCNGGRSMGDYAQAMLDLGKADSVAVVDLSIKTWTYLSAICPKPTDGSTENFFKVKPDNSIDGTHFQENGATIMAGYVADGMGEAGLALDAHRIK